MTISKMSDTELRHRRKVQGNIARTTSTLGLSGLGITGAALAARKSPGALKAMGKIPKVGAKLGKDPKIASEKLKNTALTTGIVSGGIGGVGGFNQASIYSAESKRKRKPAMPVAKSRGIEPTTAGEVGVAKNYEDLVRKEWSANASKFDSERSRMKRSQGYEDVGTAATGGLAAGAAVKGAQAGRKIMANRTPGQLKARHLPSVKAVQAGRKAAAVKHGKVGAGLLAASTATGAATLAVKNRNKSKSWSPYSKRDTTSAFGVDHEPVAKVFKAMSGHHRETDQ
jgi:hypothetical protein